MLDGRDPLLSFVNARRFKMPDFVVERHDLELVAVAIYNVENSGSKKKKKFSLGR